MSLIEQSLTKLRSETSLILASNLAINISVQNGYGTELLSFSVIWTDLRSEGLEDSGGIIASTWLDEIITNPKFTVASTPWVDDHFTFKIGEYEKTDGSNTGYIKEVGAVTELATYQWRVLSNKTSGDNIDLVVGDVTETDLDDITATGYLTPTIVGDFQINADANWIGVITEVSLIKVWPPNITSNVFDAYFFCQYNSDISYGSTITKDSQFFAVIGIEIHLDHKKIYVQLILS